MAEHSILNKILSHPLKDIKIGISPDRLMALTDGVFAIAMTLLILNIALPNFIFNDSQSMINFLESTVSQLITVIVSFIILGEYWIQHHNFIKLKRINIPFLWMNIFYLLFIMFIPFTTSIICKYEQFLISEIIFGLSITLTSLMSLVMYWYASKTDLLSKTNEIEKKHTIKSLTSLIYITILIDLLIYFISPRFLILFLIIPFYSIYIAVKREKTINKNKVEKYKKPRLLTHIKKDKFIEFVLNSKIDYYIHANYADYDNFDEDKQKEIKIEALNNLKTQLDKIIDEKKNILNEK